MDVFSTGDLGVLIISILKSYLPARSRELESPPKSRVSFQENGFWDGLAALQLSSKPSFLAC